MRIAVIAGDGIGKEVVPVARATIDCAIRAAAERALEWHDLDWGTDLYARTGAMMPPDGIETLRGFDAIFLGAIGDPARVPDHQSLWGLLIRIRRGLGQYVNVRPARSLPGLRGPLAAAPEFDLLVVRENSEGEYSEIGGRIHAGADEIALQTTVFTRRAVTRTIDFALEQARARRGLLTSATKSNGIVHTMPFWDEVFRERAAMFPDVRTEAMHVDALAARLIMDPASLDVIVASNLFADILTDITAALMGSIGVAPSANLNPSGDLPSMFEPVHGSAPDIAGKGIANPLGQIWTGVLMLDHLGYRDASRILFRAFQDALEAGECTPDLGGSLSTTAVGDRIIQRLTKLASASRIGEGRTVRSPSRIPLGQSGR